MVNQGPRYSVDSEWVGTLRLKLHRQLASLDFSRVFSRPRGFSGSFLHGLLLRGMEQRNNCAGSVSLNQAAGARRMRQLSRRLRDQPVRLKIVNRESKTVSGIVNGKSKPIRSCEGDEMIVEVLRRVKENWVAMQFECGTRILHVIHGLDARATSTKLHHYRKLDEK